MLEVRPLAEIIHLLFYLVKEKYPIWHMFMEYELNYYWWETNYNTVLNGIEEFFYSLNNTYELLYFSIITENYTILNLVSTGSYIFHKVRIRLE